MVDQSKELMSQSDLSNVDLDRVAREKQQYDDDELERDGYLNFFRRANRGPAWDRMTSTIDAIMQCVRDKEVLEVGSGVWAHWIDFDKYAPRELTCINVSQLEIQRAQELSEQQGIDIRYIKMDAHRLAFPDNSFDVVYGASILHHLDFSCGVREIRRVLRPGGLAIFREPMGVNPVAKVIRWLTPFARTVDERPLGFQELGILKGHFNATFHYDQLFSVPAGLLSQAVSRQVVNPITRFADQIDKTLEQSIPFVGPFYRRVIFVGQKQD